MSTLSDDEVKRIARDAAEANGVNVTDIVLAPAIGSTGVPALEIKYVLTPGSVQSIMGLRSATTTSQVIMHLADADDSRIPIVRYEEQGASSRS